MRLILYTFAFSQIACFRGLFSEAPRYLATEYVVDEPRIVAIQTNPMEMISGRATTFDTLLLTPRDATVESWEVSVCGLNTAMDTQTFIRDLLCFEQEESVSTLFNTTQMPTTFAVPEFPEIDCFIPEWSKDTGIFEDTGSIEEFTCSHYLPIQVKAIVDGKPVFAAAFSSWYSEVTEERELALTLPNPGIGLVAPETAKQGEEIPLEVKIASDMTSANFQWYIDAGTLLDTGITKARTFSASTDSEPYPQTTSNNRLVIPDNYEGPLRIWVVIHEPWYPNLQMLWVEKSIEVTP